MNYPETAQVACRLQKCFEKAINLAMKQATMDENKYDGEQLALAWAETDSLVYELETYLSCMEEDLSQPAMQVVIE